MKRLLTFLALALASCTFVSSRMHRAQAEAGPVTEALAVAEGIRWRPGDRLAVWSDADSLAILTGKPGRNGSATFARDSFVFVPGRTYHAVYPCPEDISAIPAVLDGPDRTWYSEAEVADGEIRFRLHGLAATLRLGVGIPASERISRFELVPLWGTVPAAAVLDGRTGRLSPTDSLARFTQAVDVRGPQFDMDLSFPAAFPDAPFALVLYGTQDTYSLRIDRQAFPAGETVSVTGTAVPLESTVPSRISVRDMPQEPAGIPSGQYSGITSLSNGSYAVVHDKSPGGGIWFFRIPLDRDGNILSITTLQASGTQDGPAGKDAEGIAYAAASGTLFVSTESDQSIREYDLEGHPTGRSLAVPADLARDRIAANKGFEALTCGEDRIWTVTEGPLKADADWLSGGRMLRIQRFSLADLRPDGRYFYRMDAPTASSAGTLAYVHGVSALAALPDGRLLVLEREVYVPNGSFLQKLTASFSRTKIYAVDPENDPAGVLTKAPVADFSCSALTLANFEGMCLGPALPDGTTPLLLVADSQNSMAGLVQEYVKVLKLGL